MDKILCHVDLVQEMLTTFFLSENFLFVLGAWCDATNMMVKSDDRCMMVKRLSRRKWDRVVSEICHEFQLRPHDVLGTYRKQIVRLHDGVFKCAKCANMWTSHRAWIKVDCKAQKGILSRFLKS